MPQNRIRNFCIIAHIDHGKSTLADRLIEQTSTVSKREMKEQLLDSMDLERERGITIKAQAVRMIYKAKDGIEYCLNLIDTPGHVDFSYEVSRSIAACEGALLVVDASQGVEAQTMANATLAIAHDLEIIPVINKIDLPAADPDKVKEEIENLIGVDCSNALLVSAKEGKGIPELLEAIIQRIPAPKGNAEKPLRGLVFDAIYDSYRGVIVYCRIIDGKIKTGDKIKFKNTEQTFEVIEAGVFTPKQLITNELETGKVGFFHATIKEMGYVNIGDTVVLDKFSDVEPIEGFQKAKQMVFCGLYPVETNAFNDLRNALEKLTLNDSSLSFFPENSLALGFGFRCGFLGLLHMEIIQERLEREYDLDLVTTAPNVVYEVVMNDKTSFEIDSPSKLPDITKISEIREPFVHATIFMPKDYIGTIMELAQDRRGVLQKMEFITESRVSISFDLPLSEIIVDFYDKLKSRTRGYASLDYDHIGNRAGDIVRVDVLVNGEKVDALSFLSHRERAEARGRIVISKLRKLIPRHQFQIPLQAAIGAKIIARENIAPLRKDVTAKCYGGDISRKRKLLEKQKEGKKRMKMVGNVEIPQSAFMAILRPEDD
ncbi:MAG: translation elongation factor 4 [Candidatus Riflebacteria bacterium]|nr:translation elongation factor 4 [Candidatus Riflebacteria bacterium]MDD3001124.1 translation elongation factor 4 [Candidatus Riflebacteria bacterium]